ncbi:MAG: cobaltochelatase subunit CobN, partial [bacterium]
ARDFLLDEENRRFLEEHNQWAIEDIGEKMLEADDRGMWENPPEDMIDQIKDVLRSSEGYRERTTS